MLVKIKFNRFTYRLATKTRFGSINENKLTIFRSNSVSNIKTDPRPQKPYTSSKYPIF